MGKQIRRTPDQIIRKLRQAEGCCQTNDKHSQDAC